MRRAALLDDAQKMSLFPFLAVLICTMGALLVLLVVIARQAMAEAEQTIAQEREQRQAEAAAEQSARAEAMPPEQVAEARHQLDRRIATLRESREATDAQRGQLRQALSDLEDHMARLLERYRNAQAAAQALAEQPGSNESLEVLRRDIAAARQAIEQARGELAEAEAKAANRKQSYAIIPYQGPNGTQRVPIYLECLPDAVVIQPFGIRLNEADFEGNLDQNNPLAAALRAASGYVARQQTSAGQPNEPPYPLLIVRPSGIHAYYAARAAMNAWTSDFGYELIDEEWPMEYAAGDPRMGATIVDAVEIARRRNAAIAAAGGPGGRYARGSGGGDGEENGGGAFGGDSPFGTKRESTAGLRGGGTAPSGAGDEESQSATGPRYGNPDANGQPQGPRLAPQNFAGNRGGDGSNPTPGEIQNLGGGNDESAANPAGRDAAGGLNPSTKPVAEARGKNWAELGASRGATAVTRPVALVIAADRVVILDNVKARNGKSVMLPGETERSVDELVSGIWDHMRGWGIAGRGLYWKPIITAHVVPGGERRAADLQTLLRGSGMELEFAR